MGGVVKGFRGRNGVADYLESLCPVGVVNFVVYPGIARSPRVICTGHRVRVG